MSITTSAPGPWEWDGDPTDDSEKFRQSAAPWLIDADENPVIKGDVVVTSEASAHLIAAAPDMLEALKTTLDDIELYLEWANSNGRTSSEIARIGQGCRTAIAKATGKESA